MAIGRFLNMQYKVGKRISKLIIIANISGESSTLSASSMNPTIAIMPNDKNISSINSVPDAFIFLLPLITNSNFSLLNTILEFLFISQMTPAIVIHDKIITLVAKAVDIPPNIKKKNIKLQKLSLFNLALIKLRIIASEVVSIYYSYVNEKPFKKLCFFRDFTKCAKNIIKYLDNKSQRPNQTDKL